MCLSALPPASALNGDHAHEDVGMPRIHERIPIPLAWLRPSTQRRPSGARLVDSLPDLADPPSARVPLSLGPLGQVRYLEVRDLAKLSHAVAGRRPLFADGAAKHVGEFAGRE